MEILHLLQKLVNINSVFPDEERIGRFIIGYLSKLGFRVKTIPTDARRNNIVATYGKSKKYLGFYGHLDTVPPDKNYKRNPFDTFQKGDRIYGLGAADMKGGITSILKLAEFAAKNSLPVKIVFGVDEENISQGAHDLIDSSHLNDVDFLIAAESGQIKNSEQRYSVCYGRRGRIGIRINVYGKTAHAAESNNGVNAIENAALLLTNLTKITFPNNQKLGSTTLVVHTISASSDSFSIPDYCECLISALTTPPIKGESVLRSLRNLANKLHISASVEQIERVTPYAESYEVDLRNSFLKKIEDSIFRPAGVKPIYAESVADENVFANRLNISAITVGPIGGGDHTLNEWVSLNSINNVIDCYQQVLSLYSQYNRN